jgi:hypothetical protein
MYRVWQRYCSFDDWLPLSDEIAPRFVRLDRTWIMDKNTGTKTAKSETPFPRLELWEDGRRIPELYQPENFEWWYFDAQLTDGRTLVLSSISTRTPSSAGSCIEPRPRSQAQMDSASLPHTSLTRRCQFTESDPKSTLAKVSSAAISTPTAWSWTRVISAS